MPARPNFRERGYTTAWDKARKGFLIRNPNCVMCAASGHLVLATRVDHIVPHKGDQRLMWDKTNWQPLCQPHHDSAKQSEERKGFSKAIGVDGWPTDARHPANGGRVR